MGRNVMAGAVVLAIAGAARTASAGSHLWQINEVFSTADGTIQFIEMKECCGASNEIFLNGKWVLSDTTGTQFDFTANLPPGSTANKHLLLATAGFAALPGAPTPDYIIADGFFSTDHDTLTYWFYAAATLEFGTGDLPTNGIDSLSADGTTGVNSPTNFNDETGSIDAGSCALQADGSPCDDNDVCTGPDVCSAGRCDGPYNAKLFADVAPIFGTVDFDDILCILDGFSDPALCPDGDIIGVGAVCESGTNGIDFDDVVAALDAFAGSAACPDPCPPRAP